ncbi:MAG: hypothetical protein JWM80_1111 [Cyanobacteria bacterium RYN_339]|nr:hypothetical protein [Cyanobacteria bacterium RYN_339]
MRPGTDFGGNQPGIEPWMVAAPSFLGRGVFAGVFVGVLALAGCHGPRATLATSPLGALAVRTTTSDVSKALPSAALTGLIRGPGAGVISNNGGGVIGNNGGGVISNNGGSLVGNNAGNLIANNSAGYRLAYKPESLVPIAGAQVARKALAGAAIDATPGNDQGGFTLPLDVTAAPPWVLEASVTREGLACIFATLVVGGVDQDRSVVLDPATSLVTKALEAAIAAGRLTPGALAAGMVDGLAAKLAPFMSERAEVVALAANAAQAAEVIAAMEKLSAPLKAALDALPGGSALVPRPSPAPVVASPTPTPTPTPPPSGGSGGGGSSGPVPTPTPIPPDPAITTFAPSSGSGGMLITVRGTDFGAAPAYNVVTFAGTPAVVRQASPTRLLLEVPEQANSGPITVSVQGRATGSPGTFNTVAHGTRLANVPGAVSDLIADPDGGVWASPYSDGLVKYDADGVELSRKTNFLCGPLALDSQRNVWAFSRGQVFKQAPDGTSLGAFPTSAVPYVSMRVDPSDNVWLLGSFSDNVQVFANSGNSLGVYTVNSRPWGLAFDAQGRGWMATDGTGEAVVMDASGNQLARYPAGPRCDHIAFDAAGNAWVTNTTTNSVTKIAPDGTQAGNFPACSNPGSVVFDAFGNAWVTEFGVVSTTVKLSPSGQLLATYPVGNRNTVVSSSGMIWLSDSNLGAIARIAP